MTRDEQRPEPAHSEDYVRGWNDALTTVIAELHTMQMEVAEQLIERLAKLPTPSESGGDK